MRVMVFVKATASSEKGMVLDAETRAMMAQMEKYNDALRAAGVMVTCDGLKPSSAGKRVTFDGAGRSVSDGPFAHPEELVAGFWIWEVEDMDEAVAWVKLCPNPMPEPSVIEIRPFEVLADLQKA